MPGTVHFPFLISSAFLRGLIVALCLTGWLTAQNDTNDGFSKPAEIQKRLAAVRAEVQSLPADAAPELRERLQQLEGVCLVHMNAVSILANAQVERDKTARELSSWHGYPQPPPYSIRLLDEIRESLETIEGNQSAANAQLRIFTSQVEAAHNDLENHQEAGRRHAELAASAGTPEDRQMAERAARIEQASTRVSSEEIARLTLLLAAQRAELVMLNSKYQLADLELKTVKDKTVFRQEELNEIQMRITRERAEAVGAMATASHQSRSPDPLLGWKIEFLDLEKNFWNTRFSALDNKNSTVRKEALATFDKLRKSVTDWNEIAQLRLVGGHAGVAEFDPVRLRDAIQQVARMKRLIGFAIEDINGSTRGTPVWDYITSGLFSLWNTELYLAEETDIVDGRKIPIFRAVTLGKLVRLAFILTVGWWILRFLSHQIAGFLSGKSKIPATTSVTIVKLFSGVGLALLVIYALNAVHIPFTAFAFLGGALAIGVGFGTQTMLKNFISGLILIFERPLRVGDVVEVEGITGRIKTIGMRASVIQHFDGIDTLIPNSNLLENQVTNWTFSSTIIRHFILVGVAYGSPTREAARILLSVAREHGLVLDDPEPEVRFEDFGDNALMFRLLFWLDTTKTQRDPLASNLRFMIDNAFADAGIVIAFPQRDVHFDPANPLRVELSHSPKTV